MRFGVVVFPGSNCDSDCLEALRFLGLEAEYLWHQESSVSGFDALVLPGGFSYGDYLRCGAIARFSPVMSAVTEFARRGGPVLGICNGFQILLEAGLLPGVLLRNECVQFRCQSTHIRVENAETAFTRGLQTGDVLQVPIAHGEGNYYLDPAGLAEVERQGQVVFRYCDADGMISSGSNPNGSLDNIAGVCNRERNVVGMMPHPERAVEELLGGVDGRRILTAVLRHWEAKVC
jgi:phosphoribosylformylglycinamidine synthase